MFVVVNKICVLPGRPLPAAPRLRLPYHIPYDA
jgi:hypothetical protein